MHTHALGPTTGLVGEWTFDEGSGQTSADKSGAGNTATIGATSATGVVGIAVGFGAQTLVRDLFSGASYLIEDVFRIGDYIEGGNAKGTVERITFRTVALRHQNGPLHFVPYGTLGSVRNNSRDWVVDKFEIPLPVAVDSERIRKLVKKIGIDMLEDPELAESIDVPLKAKLYRIDPGVKVFRCKVQTPPGKQFEVRNEAYRRIEAALKENGIAFADNTPRVTLYQGPAGEPAAAEPVPQQPSVKASIVVISMLPSQFAAWLVDQTPLSPFAGTGAD